MGSVGSWGRAGALLAAWASLAQTPGTVPEASPAPVHVSIPSGTPTLGPAGAPVTLVEFEDFQCPFCRREEPVVGKLLAEFPGKIRLVHRDLPLDIHARAFPAAWAARCAGEQGRFWEYRRALFVGARDLSDTGLKDAAVSLRLDLGAFQKCLASRRYVAVVQSSVDEALKLDIRQTPTFVLNGRVLPGAVSLEDLREAVRLALNP